MQVRDMIYLLQKQNPEAELFFSAFIEDNVKFGKDGEIVEACAGTEDFSFSDIFGDSDDPEKSVTATIIVPKSLFEAWKKI